MERKDSQVKKVLIVCDSFVMGGIQASLVNLANALVKQCQVDLFVYNPQGPLKERLSAEVHLLPSSWRTQALGMSIRQALQSGSVRTAFFRTFSAVWAKLFDNSLPLSIAFSHEPKLAGYDLAIAFYQEQRRHYTVSGFIRFIDERVEAKLKAAWLHYDPSMLDIDSAYNLPFYHKVDKIVLVSESLKEKYDALYPDLRDKTDYCYNVIDQDDLRKKSAAQQVIPYPEGKRICFSACRLSEEKAIVRGILALAPFFREHEDLMWFIAGDGPERERIQNTIREAGLEDRILLIGQQSNPYSYMRNADLLLNLSYHEAAPMVFLEAHALGVPVFATRTSSADELLDDGKTDFVCENSTEGIRECFGALMAAQELLDKANEILKCKTDCQTESIARILSWMDEGKHE